MRFYQHACGLVLIGFCFAPGEIRAADLSLETWPSSVQVMPGHAQDAVFTVRNLGTQTVEQVGVQSLRGVSAAQVEIVVANPESCGAAVMTAAGLSTVTWMMAELAPGASQRCVLRYRAMPGAITGEADATLRISALGSGDVNATNDFGRLRVYYTGMDIPVDLALEASPSVVTLARYGDIAIVDLTLRNLGPNTPGGVDIVSDPFLVANVPALGNLGFDLVPVPSSDCAVFVDSEGAGVFGVYITPRVNLAPGQSTQCQIGFRRLLGAPVSSTLALRSVARGLGVYDGEPNNSDAFITVFFGEPASSVPVARAAMLLTAGLLLILGATRLRRARNQRAC